MTEPKSKTALYLQLHAPVSCHIWFICKGHLILERCVSESLFFLGLKYYPVVLIKATKQRLSFKKQRLSFKILKW